MSGTEANNETDRIIGYRRKCETRILNEGIPSRKSEYWRFSTPDPWIEDVDSKTGVHRDLNLHGFAKTIDQRCSLKVINGIVDVQSIKQVQENLDGVEIKSLSESINKDDHWTQDFLGSVEEKASGSYNRHFAYVNGMEFSQGLSFKCDAVIDNTIHIFYLGDNQSKVCLRNLVSAGEGSNLTIVEHFYGGCKYNIVSEVTIQENSKFKHNKIFNRCLSDPLIYHFFSDCGSRAELRTASFDLANTSIRNEHFLSLEGKACEATVAGLSVGNSAKNTCDNSVFVSHLSEACKSRQVFKSVLANGAKSIFQGKIYVDPIAQKTDGYQMSNGLLLDEKSEFLVKPELEIYADDVICSHGSISGTLNEDHIFYLRSRGIQEKDAQKLLIKGYLEEIFDESDDSFVAKYVQTEIENFLI